MSPTKKNNYKATVADDLYTAINMFMQGHASPESLYVINAGINAVFRDLVESEVVHAFNESVDAYLDLYQKEMIESRTLVYNKRKGLI